MHRKNSISDPMSISVLIPDGESVLLIYVVNCLSQIPGISLFVMSNSNYNAVRFSRHISKFIYYPSTKDDQKWIQNINAEVQKHNIDIIMPIFEIGIHRIIRNKKLLHGCDRLITLPDLEAFATVINKWELATYCKENNIFVPESFLYVPGKELPNTFFVPMKFPVIVKPLEGFGGGMGIAVFDTKPELAKYLDESANRPTIIQNFIKGYDIDCSILAEDGKIIAHTIQKGYLQGDSPYAPQVGLEFMDNPKLLEVVEKLVGSLKWNGVAHLDLRYDEEDNTYKIIELNPRFWSSIDASCLMGVNFPHLLILQTLGYKFSKPVPKYESYLSLKGFVKTIKKDFFFLAKRKFIMNNTQFRFVVYDVFPTLYKYLDRTKNLLLKRIKKAW